ncbi:MAG: primase-like DNA-binding domain-containing protein [Chloroflexi bacterium]|nr:primase-like DNA-binding domain-containing protein [Chloroflexota bacterium]MDA1218526.1 primase-like DNA-binding domain-containing protein [Chloroflexota bacterium]
MESAVQIRLVRENLALAIALWAAAQKGVITAGFLPNQSEAETADGDLVRVSVPFEVRDNQELVRCVNNQIRGAFAFSAVQTNRALESVYGNSPIQGEPSELQSARCILYLLSKTFNDDLMDPVWNCPTEYRQRFEVPSISFTLDASALAGKKVYWVDFGGLSKYLDLLEFCGNEAAESKGIIEKPAPKGELAEEDLASEGPADQIRLPGNDGISDAVQLDSISSFVEARCLVDAREMIIAKDLYEAYAGWCDREGYELMAQRSFGMRLTAMGFERRRRGKGKHWWMGIDLTESQVMAQSR